MFLFGRVGPVEGAGDNVAEDSALEPHANAAAPESAESPGLAGTSLEDWARRRWGERALAAVPHRTMVARSVIELLNMLPPRACHSLLGALRRIERRYLANAGGAIEHGTWMSYTTRHTTITFRLARVDLIYVSGVDHQPPLY